MPDPRLEVIEFGGVVPPSELQTRNRKQSNELETEPRARQWGPRSLRPWPRVAHAALGHGRLYPIGDRATPPSNSELKGPKKR